MANDRALEGLAIVHMICSSAAIAVAIAIVSLVLCFLQKDRRYEGRAKEGAEMRAKLAPMPANPSTMMSRHT